MLEQQNVAEQAKIISNDFKARGWEVNAEAIIPHLSTGILIDDHKLILRWVEITDRRPGDMKDSPWLVLCSTSIEPGSVTQREYVAI